MIGEIKISLDRATDAELLNLHLSLAQEMDKRGLGTPGYVFGEDDEPKDKNSEFKPPYKSIEKL